MGQCLCGVGWGSRVCGATEQGQPQRDAASLTSMPLRGAVLDMRRRRGHIACHVFAAVCPTPTCRKRARLRATTPRVSDLGSLPSPRSLAASPRPSPPKLQLQPDGGSAPGSPPGSQLTPPARAQQRLASPRQEGGHLFGWRHLSPTERFSMGSIPSNKSLAPEAAAAVADGIAVTADGAANGAHTWHHMPSRSGRGLELQDEELWQPPDAATLARRFPPTIYLPPAPRAGRVRGALQALQAATGCTSEHAALALQLAVAMAAACTLHVVEESYSALKEKTIWWVGAF